MNNTERLYGIQEIAEMLGVTSRTLRFYESKGLILPHRVGAIRVYRVREIERIRLIVRAKCLGLSLTGIADFLDLYEPAERHPSQAQALADRLKTKIIHLRQQRVALEQTISELVGLEWKALASARAQEIGDHDTHD